MLKVPEISHRNTCSAPANERRGNELTARGSDVRVSMSTGSTVSTLCSVLVQILTVLQLSSCLVECEPFPPGCEWR